MDTPSKIEFFNQLPVLASLSDKSLTQLAQMCHLRRAPRFQFVYMPDQPIDHLYFLVNGRIKIGSFTADGREILKEILLPGALFGDLGLAGSNVHVDYAQVLHDDATFLTIALTDFRNLMQQNPCLVFSVLGHLSQRLQRMEERLTKLVSKDARERIIEFLVETADKEGHQIGFETLVKHHLTQADIASLTGTSRQTVTSVLNDLKKSNLIYFRRNSILIRDVAKLA
ncbi:MAG: Crp/Fnr family transcriptional regulator [Saprospiraceae bacterium]